MKPRYYFIFFCALSVIVSCKKEGPTRDIKFSSTKYETFGYDATGKPNYLLKDAISPDLLSFIENLLPDGKSLPSTHPELFSNTAIADVAITKASDVYLTYVHSEGAFSNSIAFYTYPTNSPPASTKDVSVITYVFPNAGNKTPLVSGDKIKIGSFDAGTSIGFVLMQDAWDTINKKPDNEAIHFCSNDILNPETDPKLRKHAVLVNYAPEDLTLIGFEDKLRTKADCDNDFNDVVVYCTVEEK